jgi:hypothetical protein
VISTIVIRENQVQAACARKIALESPLINISRDPIFETTFSPGNEKKCNQYKWEYSRTVGDYSLFLYSGKVIICLLFCYQHFMTHTSGRREPEYLALLPVRDTCSCERFLLANELIDTSAIAHGYDSREGKRRNTTGPST